MIKSFFSAIVISFFAITFFVATPGIAETDERAKVFVQRYIRIAVH